MSLVEKSKIEISAEKFIVTSLIVSDVFSHSICPILKSNLELLKTSYVKVVSKWCIDFYEKYKTAPKKQIQDIFKQKQIQEDDDEDTFNFISSFLNHISNNFEREENYNELYAIEQAKEYLTEQKLKQTKSELNIAISNKDIDDAENIISSYTKLRMFDSELGIDLLNDKDAILKGLSEEEDKLFRLPGALGKISSDFIRGDLVSIAAPAKRGKTFFLIDIAIRALMNKLRVVFFSFEMTQGQMIKRICQNYLGELKNPVIGKDFEMVEVPFFAEQENNKFSIDYKQSKKYGLKQKDIFRKLQGIKRISKGGAFRLFCQPPNSMTMGDISSCIDALVLEEGFVPDVIVIDYADIVLSERRSEHRHEIDSVWRGAKGIALEKHCLVVTGSHTNKSTFNKDVGQSDLSEDYRKMNHVSVMMALNQTFEEKKKGIMRIKSLANRHENFTDEEIVVLCNLDIGKPYLDSRLSSEVEI